MARNVFDEYDNSWGEPESKSIWNLDEDDNFEEEARSPKFNVKLNPKIAAISVASILGIAVLASVVPGLLGGSEEPKPEPTPIVANPIAVPSKDAGWLETLNYYRLSSGVEPVTENPIFSANAMKHSIYLAKSDPKYFTGIYESPHSENPESPYYTIEGANSRTNLHCCTARESDAIDGWMQAPLHAIGLLRDNLKTTGYATAIDDRTGRAYTGLDVGNGLVGSRRKVITFPGDGAIVRLNKFVSENPDPRESCGKDWEKFRGLPIFASLISTPPRDITGKVVTPDGKTLLPGDDLCVVTQYSWISTDRVISYGNKIMAGEKLVLLIARSPLSPGEHSVSVSGTGISPLNWKFTILQP
jgi:uncharacterized protein YkwD